MNLIFSVILPFCFSIFSESPSASEVFAPQFTAYDVTHASGPSEKVLPYFKGHGLSPSWKLSIAEDSILFESDVDGYSRLQIPHLDPTKKNGRKLYTLQPDREGELKISIAYESCSITGSNESFVYGLLVEIDKADGTSPKVFSGCGHYLTDRNLEGQWVLKQINGIDVDSFAFHDNMPTLEIWPDRNSFAGFAGCNKINGRIFSERSLLRFTDLVTTKMACPDLSGEEQFLKALSFSTQFKVMENTLTLSNPMKETLIFELDAD